MDRWIDGENDGRIDVPRDICIIEVGSFIRETVASAALVLSAVGILLEIWCCSIGSYSGLVIVSLSS